VGELGEGVAGWGDTITFGATNWVREELGINNIDACSGAYQAGGYAGLATAALIPGEGEAELGARILDSAAAHIFRDAAGHLIEDTAANRALLEGAAKAANYGGTDVHGVATYREVLADGRQIWVEVRNGTIRNGGINVVPR